MAQTRPGWSGIFGVAAQRRSVPLALAPRRGAVAAYIVQLRSRVAELETRLATTAMPACCCCGARGWQLRLRRRQPPA